jgi:lysophospholipase L1-like esterase
VVKRVQLLVAVALTLVVGGATPVAAQTPVDGLVPNAGGDLVYAALGDSFTSGPLVLPHDSSRVPEDCGQSTRNYPHQVANIFGVSELRDMSCGSARIPHFYEPQGGLPAGGTNEPQFVVLDEDVDIVTVGIGGNDVGFTGAAMDCLRFSPTDDPCAADMEEGEDRVARRIPETLPVLVQALEDIAELAPNAEIFVVNYLESLPDDGVACWPYVPILQEDMTWLVQRFKDMNAMLAEAANIAGVTLIDIYTPSIGHNACQPPGIAWVNGMVLVPPSFPAHPNDLAYLNLSPVIAQAIEARLAEAQEEEEPEAPGRSGETPVGEGVGGGRPDEPPGHGVRAQAAANPQVLPVTGASQARGVAIAVGLTLLAIGLRRRLLA